MRKPILAAIAVACLTLTAGMCEQEEVVANVCKNKSEVACMQDTRCQWKTKDDGTQLCKPAD
jgi:hypothetical protein